MKRYLFVLVFVVLLFSVTGYIGFDCPKNTFECRNESGLLTDCCNEETEFCDGDVGLCKEKIWECGGNPNWWCGDGECCGAQDVCIEEGTCAGTYFCENNLWEEVCAGRECDDDPYGCGINCGSCGTNSCSPDSCSGATYSDYPTYNSATIGTCSKTCSDGSCQSCSCTVFTEICSASKECDSAEYNCGGGTVEKCRYSNAGSWEWTTSLGTETSCNDNYDNDCDGDVDCIDLDCISSGNCDSYSWDARLQSGDTTWSDATSGKKTVRIFISHEFISVSGNQIRIAFRSGTDDELEIIRPTICEVDTGNDCVGSTWKNLSFNGNHDYYTIPIDSTRWTDELYYEIDKSKDYYVTFKIGDSLDGVPYLKNENERNHYRSQPDEDWTRIEDWPEIGDHEFIFSVEFIDIQNIQVIQDYYCDEDNDNHYSEEISGSSVTVPANCALAPGDDCDDSKLEVYPGNQEVCDGLDNNCDGDIDLVLGDAITKTCYEGSPGTMNVGICKQGKSTCVDGVFGECVGQILPELNEICDAESNDENCDGRSNEDCSCTPETKQSCGVDAGECEKGLQICQQDGTWGDCVGGIIPSEEICDNKDNDCDGNIDNNADCCDINNPVVVCYDDSDCPGIEGVLVCENWKYLGCEADCAGKIELVIYNPLEKTYTTSCEDEKQLTLDYEYWDKADCFFSLNDNLFQEASPKLSFNAPLGNNELVLKCLEKQKTVRFEVVKPDTCESIEQEVTEDTTRTFEKEGFSEDDIETAEETNENVQQELKYAYSNDSTYITNSITPTKTLENFTYNLYIPKCLTEYLDDIDFEYENYEIIKDDPLIAWHFVDVDERIDLSYKVKGKIDSECLAQIQGLPIAFIPEESNDNKVAFLVFIVIILLVMVGILGVSNRSLKENMALNGQKNTVQTSSQQQVKQSNQQPAQQAESSISNYIEHMVKAFKTDYKFMPKQDIDSYLQRLGVSDEIRKRILDKL